MHLCVNLSKYKANYEKSYNVISTMSIVQILGVHFQQTIDKAGHKCTED